MPRTYQLNLKGYNISDARQRELKAFCEQYDEKKQKLRDLYSLSSPPFDAPVQGGLPGNPTEQKAIKAQKLQHDIDLIDGCLKKVMENQDDATGEIERRLKKNVTRRQGTCSGNGVPCSPATFYRLRIRFFGLLDLALSEQNNISYLQT